jgi:hypothetical protein
MLMLSIPTNILVGLFSCSDSLPTLEELKGFLKDSRMEEGNWVLLKNTAAKSILKNTFDQRKIKSSAASSISTGGSIEDTTMVSGTSGRKIVNSMFASESSLEVRGGTEITLDALAAYLKYLEGTGNASWQEYVSPTSAALQLNSFWNFIQSNPKLQRVHYPHHLCTSTVVLTIENAVLPPGT